MIFHKCDLARVSAAPIILGLGLGIAVSCSAPPPGKPTYRGGHDRAVDKGGPQVSGNGDAVVSNSEDPKPGPNPSTPATPSATPSATPVVTPPSPDPLVPKTSLLFIGGGSAKIDVYKFDKTSGAATLLKSTATPGANPTFIAVSPKKKLLFAADETGSTILSFSIDTSSGTLKALNSQPMPGGPAHVAVDADGKWVFAASYGNGHVASFPVQADGKLGVASSDIFAGLNAHEVVLSPEGSQAWVPCLGSNYIAQYALSATGQWTPSPSASLSVGTGGPRHIDTHPNGKWAYLINELASSVQALTYDGDSLKLNGAAVSSLRSAVNGNSGAEIQVHPAGKFVYASNRGDDSIAIFAIGDTGAVTLQKTVKTGGKSPRHFAMDSSGSWMTIANQDAGGVTIFSVNGGGGDLTAKSGSLSYDSAQYARIFDFDD